MRDASPSHYPDAPHGEERRPRQACVFCFDIVRDGFALSKCLGYVTALVIVPERFSADHFGADRMTVLMVLPNSLNIARAERVVAKISAMPGFLETQFIHLADAGARPQKSPSES